MTTEPSRGLGRFFTPAQVAEQLQVSGKTVLRWIEAGELPAHKLGRQWRIAEADLKRFLHARWQG